MDASTKPPPTVGALLGSLASETGTLVRQEIQLASTEMGEKAGHAAGNLGTVLVGGALVHAGLIAVLLGVAVALGAFLPLWVCAVGLGVAVAGGGYALVRKGLDALHGLDPTPKTTLATLRAGAPVLKEHAQ